MRRGFFWRLAVLNIRKNREIFLPYVISSVVCIAMLYMMLFIKRNPGLEQMHGGSDIAVIMSLGIAVVGIFSFVFLLYTNSILMKRRQNEIGLYNILGLEKGHIGRMLFLETLLTSFFNIGGGILAGVLGSKLALLFLLRLMHLPVVFGFFVSAGAVSICCVFFGIVFFITFLNNVRRVHMSHPVELLSGSRVGEREPKAKWLMALIGFLCLGAGYYIAVTTQSPLDALLLFFLAVILVMAGTYLLFTAGSIAVLKILRWNKKFYYKTRNFTSVSGMIYRMKQNAVGLANICILSTGVLLMLSSTVCLYFGMNDVMKYRYPMDMEFSYRNVTLEEAVRILDRMEEILEKEKVPVEKAVPRIYDDFTCKRKGDAILFPEDQEIFTKLDDLRILLKDSYELVTGEDTGLSDGETFLYCGEKPPEDVLYIGEESWRIRKVLTEEPLEVGEFSVMDEMMDETIVMVVTAHDYEKIFSMVNERYGMNLLTKAEIAVDIEGGKDEDVSYWAEVISSYRQQISQEEVEGLAEGKRESFFTMANVRTWDAETYYSMYGGLFFLGIFLGGLFLMGVTMIIFYKQLSEGYEDKGRFDVMRKVGMSRAEVKASIHRQILMVFFLPLVMASIHIAIAFPIVRKLLMVLGMFNVKLFIFCTAGTILIFAVVYAVIYAITAKVYYRILDGGAGR